MVSTRTRLIIDVTPELRRRIKLAAAAGDVSVRAYVVSILERAVPSEPVPRAERGRLITREDLERLDATRKAIMRGRTFADDSADLIRQMREERSAEEQITEAEWLRAARHNPALAELEGSEEEIYTLQDGKPFRDEG